MKRTASILCLAALSITLAFAQEGPGTSVKSEFALGDLFTVAPELEFGLTSEFASILQSDKDLKDDAGYFNAVFDPMAVQGYGFSLSPWLTLKWNGLELYNAIHYDHRELSGSLPELGGVNDFWSDYRVAESELRFEAGAFSLTERLLFDMDAADYYEDFTLAMASGNVEAKFQSFAAYDPAASFLILNGGFTGHVVADAYLKVNGLFGMADLFVGGVDARYLRLKSLFWDEEHDASFFETDIGNYLTKPVFSSQSVDIGMAQSRTTVGVGAAVPYVLDPDYLLVSEFLRIGPIDLYFAQKLPFLGDSLRDWFRTNNAQIGIQYTLGELGILDAGWDLGIGYTEDYFEILGTYYKDYRNNSLGNNKFWLDASLKLVEGLDLQAGADLRLFGFRDMDESTGTGVIGAPFVYGYSTAWVANIGIEAMYDMESMVSGLSLEAGVYLALWGGKTYDSVNAGAQTFAQYLDATYPSANYYRMDSLTEQAFLNNPIGAGTLQYDALYPFTCYLGASYALSEAWSLRLADKFIAKSTDINPTLHFTDAPTPAIGYASSNILELGARYREGNAELSFDIGWIALLGVPSIDDLGYTDAIAQTNGYATAKDNYRAEGPFSDNPFMFRFGLLIEL